MSLSRHVLSTVLRSRRPPRAAVLQKPPSPHARRNTTDATSSGSSDHVAVAEANNRRALEEDREEMTPDEGTFFDVDEEGTPRTIHPLAPNLMQPDIVLDLADTKTYPSSRGSKYQNTVIVRNDPSMFNALRDRLKEVSDDPQSLEPTASTRAHRKGIMSPLTAQEERELYIYPIVKRRVLHQTGKGKILRRQAVVVVGNRNGLVGIGDAKGSDLVEAIARARSIAVRNMDYVERYEGRTIWTEMENKFASTRVIMRPRPVGFGLHCNPNLYYIFKAAGIKDISAKVWGSRNQLQVIRAAMRMLMPGVAPLAMGDGIGGKGRRLDKLSGMRTKDELERERGRKLVPLRLM